jgi:hypothetical protein
LLQVLCNLSGFSSHLLLQIAVRENSFAKAAPLTVLLVLVVKHPKVWVLLIYNPAREA